MSISGIDSFGDNGNGEERGVAFVEGTFCVGLKGLVK